MSLTSRHWLFRASVTINIFVLVYLALYSSSENLSSGGTDVPPHHNGNQSHVTSSETIINAQKLNGNNNGVEMPLPQLPSDNKINEGSSSAHMIDNVDFPEHADHGEPVQFDNSEMLSPLKSPDPLYASPREKLFECDDLTPRTYYALRGQYWVLYNYIKAELTFHCDETITYTTHGDYTFLDNLIPLLERWQGPLSIAMYAPFEDFTETLVRIRYLRSCAPQAELVRKFATFHIYFDAGNFPKDGIPSDPLSPPIDCSVAEEPRFGENLTTMKKRKRLVYPVNVARNVARDMSTTYLVLASDIELYPNPGLIPDFMDLIRRNVSLLTSQPPKVFVLSIFEVESFVWLPEDKNELLTMLKNKTAIPFHKYVCAECHKIPKAIQWMNTKKQEKMQVFHVGKRNKPFQHWEPIYIGTKFEPIYDERLSWEGRSDKMTQGYILCVMDYEFHILNNGFLVHRPGIKRKKVIPKKNPKVAMQNNLIRKTILPQLKSIYGSREGCTI